MMTGRPTRSFLTTLFACVLIFCISRASAFWSQYGFDIHQEITKTALNTTALKDGTPTYTFKGTTYRFTDKAITAINKWHKIQDSDPYHPADHFDGEHLADGFQQLQTSRLALEDMLANPTDPDVIWLEVGVMLHQIQDYYSHSTYLASGHTDIQRFGLLTDPTGSATLPQWFTTTMYPLGKAECDSDRKTLLPAVSSSQLLTTGYYQPTDADLGKCNHGLYSTPAKVAVYVKCPIGTPADGIARDHPCSSIQQQVDDFNLAHDKATEETIDFVKAITDKLDQSGNAAGFCALLGLDPSVAICTANAGAGGGGNGGGAGGGTGIGSSGSLTGTITADPPSVVTGDSATLSWDSQNAASCYWSGGGISGSGIRGTASTGPLITTTTYTITCTDSAGDMSAPNTTSVTVSQSPPPTVSLTSNPNPPVIPSGTTLALTWDSQDASSCTATGGWSGLKAIRSTEVVGPLTASTSFTITCSSASGVQSAPATVAVTVTPSQPTVTLTATPATVTSGAAAVLTWSSMDATSCVAAGGWTTSTATSGTASTGPLTATTTYSMTCSDTSGTASNLATATVTVGLPAPTITFTATPGIVPIGGFSTLAWSVADATSCSATGGWSTSTDITGSQVVGPLTATTLYELICVGAGGASNLTVGVTVAPVVLTIAPSAPSVPIGGSITLTVTARQNGSPIDTPTNLVWDTSDSTLATVNNGTITGVAVGSPQITVTDRGSGATALVTVTVTNTEMPPTSLQIDPKSVSVSVGSSVALTVSAQNASGTLVATPPNLTWTSLDTSVATVTGGVVLGVAPGSVTVTVTDPASTVSTSATVEVTGFYDPTPWLGNWKGTLTCPASFPEGAPDLAPPTSISFTISLRDNSDGDGALSVSGGSGHLSLGIWTIVPSFSIFSVVPTAEPQADNAPAVSPYYITNLFLGASTGQLTAEVVLDARDGTGGYNQCADTLLTRQP